MCGIAGCYSSSESLINKFKNNDVLNKIGKSLNKRGPDNSSFIITRQNSCFLFHTRLAIIDLSNAATQPMYSLSKRFAIVFNGEIYNYKSLRAEIGDKYGFITSSDTEVILAYCELFGVKSFLKRAEGMFAFALFDSIENKIILARDRFGEKPLYFSLSNERLLFGSEIKVIKEMPTADLALNLKSIHEFFKYGYISQSSVYSSIEKVLPSHLCTFSINENGVCLESNECYWHYPQENRSGEPFSEEEVIDNFNSIFTSVVSDQMISDVPLGAFLSGGLDSTLIVATMQQISSNRVNTFTIGFEDKNVNEARYAKEIANFLGTEHHELYVSNKELIDNLPTAIEYLDEPLLDPSFLPTFLLSKITRASVTVAISGDGGDELFGGYLRYKDTIKLYNLICRTPLLFREMTSSSIKKLSTRQINFFDKLVNLFLDKRSGYYNLFDKLAKKGELLVSNDIIDLYDKIISHESNTDNYFNPEFHLNEYIGIQTVNAFSNYDLTKDSKRLLSEIDFASYLVNNVLVKVDRASMANSLETRAPFLNHRLIEYIWSLPSHQLYSRPHKWIIKSTLSRHMPSNLYERPKMGFTVPLSDWLRGPLKEWAYELIRPNSIRQTGFLNEKYTSYLWEVHQNGKRNMHHQLWAVICLQNWLRKNNI